MNKTQLLNSCNVMDIKCNGLTGNDTKNKNGDYAMNSKLNNISCKKFTKYKHPYINISLFLNNVYTRISLPLLIIQSCRYITSKIQQ